MSKVIEIIDSDDDNHTSIDTPSTSITSSSINSMQEQDDNQQSQSRRRRRKSVLHAMSDPDMHFLTISLEDDDDDVAATPTNSTPSTPVQRYQAKSTANPGTSSRTLLKTPRATPKILANKPPTVANVVDEHYDKFLNDPETISDLYVIAEERARINYLLSLNGMPDINFTLYTRPERLQFQLEERLKQRKMVHDWDNARMQDNRSRSLLQKNNEPNTT